MFKEFEKLKKDLESVDENNLDKLDIIIEDINIDDVNFNEWVQSIFSDEVFELNINVVPYLIDSLYKINDKYKFMLCCMLLESLCNDLPFITNLETYPMFKEKYLVLKPTIIDICSRTFNGFSNCMYLIVISCDPKGELFIEEERAKFISSINSKFEKVVEFLSNNNEVSEEAYYLLEVLLDVATYINDDTTKEYVNKISKLTLNELVSIFLLKFEACNNIPLSKEKLQSIIKSNGECLYKLLKIFEAENKVNMLPIDSIEQEQVAKSCMIDWLKYPTELGKAPDEIELIDTFEKNSMIYYIFKFKSDVFADKGYMLGVTGGYEKETISASNTGHTFSFFETLTDDYLTQANKIVDTIIQHWQKQAEDIQES